MKKTIKSCLLVAVLIMGTLFALTACGQKGTSDNKPAGQSAPAKNSTTVTYTNPDPAATISVSYPEGSSYTFIDSTKDGTEGLRTSRDDAGISADKFLVTFEVDEFFFSSDTFETEKQDAVSKDQYKEVTYNGISGYSYYYPEYCGYIINLPIDDKCYLRVGVYPQVDGKWASSETDETAKAAFELDEVQALLNTIKIN